VIFDDVSYNRNILTNNFRLSKLNMFEVFCTLFLIMHSDETEAIFILNYEYFWQKLLGDFGLNEFS
jgi:hypothetical protein